MKHAIRIPLMPFRPRPLRLALALALAAWSLPSSAQEVPISQLPLTIGKGGVTIYPNLFYIHDDSGSMAWSIKSSGSPSADDYDPNTNYPPPVGYYNSGDGQGEHLHQLPPANPTAAWNDGYTAGPTQSSVGRVNVAQRGGMCSGRSGADLQNCANWFSYYRTRLYSSKAGISRAFENLNENIRVAYGSIGHNGSPPSVMVRGVRPFKDFTDDIRYGDSKFKKGFYDWLFGITTTGVGTPLHNALHKAGQYYQNDADPWKNFPGAVTPQAGDEDTPLSCRKNFTLLMTDGEWNQTRWAPKDIGNADGTSSGRIVGVDEHGAALTYTYAGDEMLPFSDDFIKVEEKDRWGRVTNTYYSPTLADIAMYYWKRDLKPGLENNVPRNLPRDPAFWQHMTTFTVGFGQLPLTLGNVDDIKAKAFAAADTKRAPPFSWTSPTDESKETHDDLLHAAVNGHGDFFLASNAEEFQTAIESLLQQTVAGGAVSGPVGAMSSSSTALTTDTRLFVTSFDSEDWSGKLEAYKLCTRADMAATPPRCSILGERITPALWTARLPMTGAGVVDGGRRTILTWNQATSSGVGFTGPNLPDDVVSDDVVNGVRNHSLGDIINSGVLYINPGVDDYGWLQAGSLNKNQRDAYLQRMRKAVSAAAPDRETVLVGSNDGMLHAFEDRNDANGGRERFAYVPNAIAETLPELVSPEGAHLYRVDGTPVSGDIIMENVDGAQPEHWHTVVVGSTGAGGRAYFALDVEDPDNPVVLWERSGGNRADNSTADEGFHTLGVALGEASIVRTNSPDYPWVAIFGNGYNSRAGSAAATDAEAAKSVTDYNQPNRSRLFIVDARNGELVRQISTQEKSLDKNKPTGLSTPLAVDYNQDKAIDAVYAGDLQGNLWRFDLSDPDYKKWRVSFGGNPLFQARDSGGKAQSITAQPQAMRIKNRSDRAIIYFGTGRFFAEGDFENTNVQSFYGVVDPCGSRMKQECKDDALNTLTGRTNSSLVRGDLNPLALTAGSVNGTRLITKGAAATKSDADKGGAGFYVDFPQGSGGNGSERVIASMLTYYDRIFINTVIPTMTPPEAGGGGDQCTGGPSNGTNGWLYAVDPWSGTQLTNEVFVGMGPGIGGIYQPGGTGQTLTPVGPNVYPPGTNTPVQLAPGESTGRRYWRQPR